MAKQQHFIWAWGRLEVEGPPGRNVPTPRLVQALESSSIRSICAGRSQVVAVTHSGQIFSWGTGLNRLGASTSVEPRGRRSDKRLGQQRHLSIKQKEQERKAKAEHRRTHSKHKSGMGFIEIAPHHDLGDEENMCFASCSSDEVLGVSSEGRVFRWGIEECSEFPHRRVSRTFCRSQESPRTENPSPSSTSSTASRSKRGLSFTTMPGVAEADCEEEGNNIISDEHNQDSKGSGDAGDNTVIDVDNNSTLHVDTKKAKYATEHGEQNVGTAKETKEIKEKQVGDSACVPVTELAEYNISRIAAGNGFWTALTDDGQVLSWGYNETHGRLGRSTYSTQGSTRNHRPRSHTQTSSSNDSSHDELSLERSSDQHRHSSPLTRQNHDLVSLFSSPVDPGTCCPKPIVSLDKKVVSLACGWAHTAMITDEGSVYTMGCGRGGRLGIGGTRDYFQPTLVGGTVLTSRFPHGSSFDIDFDDLKEFNQAPKTSVTCGYHHTMCVNAYGQVFAWGTNDKGQLGVGKHVEVALTPLKVDVSLAYRKRSCPSPMPRTYSPSTSPSTSTSSVPFHPTKSQFISVSEPPESTLSHPDYSSSSSSSQDATDSNVTQTAFRMEDQVVSISAGAFHSGCLNACGELFMWGWGAHGELGCQMQALSSSACVYTPTIVEALSGMDVNVLCCGGTYTVAVTDHFMVVQNDYFADLDGASRSNTSSPLFQPVEPRRRSSSKGVAIRQRSGTGSGPSDVDLDDPDLLLSMTPQGSSPPVVFEERTDSPKRFPRSQSNSGRGPSGRSVASTSSFASSGVSISTFGASPFTTSKNNRVSTYSTSNWRNSERSRSDSARSISPINPSSQRNNSSSLTAALQSSGATSNQLHDSKSVSPSSSASSTDQCNKPMTRDSSASGCGNDSQRKLSIFQMMKKALASSDKPKKTVAISASSSDTKVSADGKNKSSRTSAKPSFKSRIASIFGSSDSSSKGGAANSSSNGTNRSNSNNTSGTEQSKQAVQNSFRPANLPPKSPSEISKHRKEVERMNDLYRRKLQREAKGKAIYRQQLLKKQFEEHKQRERRHTKAIEREQRLDGAAQVWLQTIVPQWGSKKSNAKAAELVLKVGIPPQVRGKVWPLAIGNSLLISSSLYSIFAEKAARARKYQDKVRERKLRESEKAMAKVKASLIDEKETKGSTENTEDEPDCVSDSNSNEPNNDEQDAIQAEPPIEKPSDEEKSSLSSSSSWSPSSSSSHDSSSETVANDAKNNESENDNNEKNDDQASQVDDELEAVQALGELLGKEDTFSCIEIDLARTFPELAFFQSGCPMNGQLQNLLETFCFYRPDVGYVQGMSYLAGNLLLYTDTDDMLAFRCFANLISRPIIYMFLQLDLDLMQQRFDIFSQVLRENEPHLYAHFAEICLSPDLYFMEWCMTLFGKRLELDVVGRVWDCYLVFGEVFVYRTAVGILSTVKDKLLGQPFEMCMRALTKSTKEVSEERLMKAIEKVKVNRALTDLVNRLQQP